MYKELYFSVENATQISFKLTVRSS